MTAKTDKASFESIVSEAFEKMRGLTAAGPSYEVDRSTGQLVVKRALRPDEIAFPADVLVHLVGNRNS
ncbi:MAG: hypothetical protein ACXW2I_14830 [Burkholderiales bacterium]